MAKNKNWDLIISSKRDWFNLDLRNIWKYRDLILFFIRRDITTEYKQTILRSFIPCNKSNNKHIYKSNYLR